MNPRPSARTRVLPVHRALTGILLPVAGCLLRNVQPHDSTVTIGSSLFVSESYQLKLG